MIDQLTVLATTLGVSLDVMVLFGIGLGVLIAFAGMYSVLADRNPAAARIAATAISLSQARQDRGLLRAPDADPRGLMKSFIPTDASKRTELALKLSQAGYSGPRALRNFTVVRAIFGLLLPLAFLALVAASKTPGIVLPLDLGARLAHLESMQTFQIVSLLVATGYFGPLMWLRGRVADRHRRIQEAFPNALDLMQISVESGMGFDAAMTRVGNELATVSPDIAFEFLSVQRQVQAGRAREIAMQDMASRTGVEIVRSFANVVQQSMQFGTSMSEALTTYAGEMRAYREMRAQEMANKLPVKMSGVLASLMLPALILLTVGPVLIRYIRYFGG